MAVKRDEALADMSYAIAAGTLRIRQLTPEERLLHAPRPRTPRKRWAPHS